MFMTVSHWDAPNLSDDMVAQAEAKFMPMIMQTGAEQAFMVQTDEKAMMVVIHFPDAETGQSALPKISQIRETAAEEFGMTMQMAAAGTVRAHR